MEEEEVDVLYVTRVQKERFKNAEAYKYKISKKTLKDAKDDLIIMHPLPRTDEIDEDLYDDKRLICFEQVGFGVTTRMAIIDIMTRY